MPLMCQKQIECQNKWAGGFYIVATQLRNGADYIILNANLTKRSATSYKAKGKVMLEVLSVCLLRPAVSLLLFVLGMLICLSGEMS